MNKIDTIAELLSEIVEQEKDCIFDLTGGDAVSLAAMGLIYERYRNQKQIRMHHFDALTGCTKGCDFSGEAPKMTGQAEISVAENIMLYGGTVRFTGYRGEKSEKTTAKLWRICCSDPAGWNRAVSDLRELESRREAKEDRLAVTISTGALAGISNAEQKLKSADQLLSQLQKSGLIHNYSCRKDSISYCYQNDYVRHCLEKAGNILEAKVLSVAGGMLDDDGRPYYSDAKSGAAIDWDGDLEDAGTCNEIDVLLMRGVIPVFISCKNGEIDDDELYKLNTVALRFGGIYAKKALIASEMRRKGAGTEYFMQRAEDMGILVIDNMAHLTDKMLEEKLRNL